MLLLLQYYQGCSNLSVTQGVETAQDVAGSTLGTPKPALQSMAVIPSLSLRHMLVLQQTGFTAATTNAISTATHVNSTLGNTIQQLQQSVEEVEGVLPEVEAAVDGDTTYDHKKNLLDLEHTVLALEVGPCTTGLFHMLLEACYDSLARHPCFLALKHLQATVLATMAPREDTLPPHLPRYSPLVSLWLLYRWLEDASGQLD